MKYTLTLYLSGPNGYTTELVDFISKAGEEYTFDPLHCVPNDSKIVGIQTSHGEVIDWIEHHNPNNLPELCCNPDIIGVTPTPTPTYVHPIGLEAPRAPYDLSIAYGSIVFGWFHDNSWPKTADYFDVYRSTDTYNYDFV